MLLRVTALALFVAGWSPAFGEAPAVGPEVIERPFLWRIEGERPSFLFGSIHLPDERVHAHAPVLEEALAASDVLLTEIPLDMESMMTAQAAQMLGESTPLSERLPPELYARAEAYLASKGLPITAFSRVKLWALWVTLGQIEYLSEMMKRPALDMALWQRAGELGKERAAVETLQEQLAVFEAFTSGELIQLIAQTLDDLEAAREGASPMERLVEEYVSGDLDALYALLTESVDVDSVVGRKFVTRLVTERNVRMAERIAARLQAEPEKAHFFVIGTLHYPGERGLLALLRKQGLALSRLSAGDSALPTSRPLAPALGE